MSYGPFSPSHIITAAEYNEFVAALDAEVVRATGAEATLAAADTALAARATALETFQGKVNGLIPTVGTAISLRLDASHLLSQSALEASGAYVGQLGAWTGSQAGYTFNLSLNPLFNGCKILQFILYLKGVAWGSLPSTQNVISLVSYDPSTETETTIDSYADAASTVGAYNTLRSTGHVLSSPHTTSATKSYYLRVAGAVGGSDSGTTRAMLFREAIVLVSG